MCRRTSSLKSKAIGQFLLAAAFASGIAQAQVKDENPVSRELLDLMIDVAAHIESGHPMSDFSPTDSALHVKEGLVLVDATSKESGEQLLAELDSLGLMNGAAVGRLVSGWLPVRSIEALQNLEYLKSVRAAAMSTGPSGSSPPRKMPCK
jgi:hypothetical protein